MNAKEAIELLKNNPKEANEEVIKALEKNVNMYEELNASLNTMYYCMCNKNGQEGPYIEIDGRIIGTPELLLKELAYDFKYCDSSTRTKLLRIINDVPEEKHLYQPKHLYHGKSYEYSI